MLKDDPIILEKMRETLSQHKEIIAAYIYGSYARGHMRTDSDIDIGILLSDESAGGGLYPMRIAQELREVCQLKRDFDVRILNRGTIRFLHQVLKGELLCSRDERIRISFETSVTSKYLDLKPLFEEYDRMRKMRLLQ